MKRHFKVVASTNSGWIPQEDLEEMDVEELWLEYFSRPEDEVAHELKLFFEPSTQNGVGDMVIFDESGQDRFEPVEIDFSDWCDKEYDFAEASSSEEDYKRQFRDYVKKLCKI